MMYSFNTVLVNMIEFELFVLGTMPYIKAFSSCITCILCHMSCKSLFLKTLCCSLLLDKMTYLGQKFCVVVYPDMGNSGGSGEEGEEMKEARSPLSKADVDNHKSADC